MKPALLYINKDFDLQAQEDLRHLRLSFQASPIFPSPRLARAGLSVSFRVEERKRRSTREKLVDGIARKLDFAESQRGGSATDTGIADNVMHELSDIGDQSPQRSGVSVSLLSARKERPRSWLTFPILDLAAEDFLPHRKESGRLASVTTHRRQGSRGVHRTDLSTQAASESFQHFRFRQGIALITSESSQIFEELMETDDLECVVVFCSP